eukprot:6213695-Pleurochrysis_carterae.AAC.2
MNEPEQGLYPMPPVRATGKRALLSNIHDSVAKCKKQARRQRLGEEVRQAIGAAHKRHSDVVRLDAFSHEEMSSIDMLGALVVLRIVCEIDGRLVVRGQTSRRFRWQSQIDKATDGYFLDAHDIAAWLYINT